MSTIENGRDDFVEYLESKGTKRTARVLKYLDRDLVSIVKWDGHYFLEENTHLQLAPNYVWHEFQMFVKSRRE